jgi:hypothetical protein
MRLAFVLLNGLGAFLNAGVIWGFRRFAILALIGFKSTYAIQDKTAASSLLVVKAGLRFKTPFPQIFLEKIWTASAGPKGERQGWQRIKFACAAVFFIGLLGNRLT